VIFQFKWVIVTSGVYRIAVQQRGSRERPAVHCQFLGRLLPPPLHYAPTCSRLAPRGYGDASSSSRLEGAPVCFRPRIAVRRRWSLTVWSTGNCPQTYSYTATSCCSVYCSPSHSSCGCFDYCAILPSSFPPPLPSLSLGIAPARVEWPNLDSCIKTSAFDEIKLKIWFESVKLIHTFNYNNGAVEPYENRFTVLGP